MSVYLFLRHPLLSGKVNKLKKIYCFLYCLYPQGNLIIGEGKAKYRILSRYNHILDFEKQEKTKSWFPLKLRYKTQICSTVWSAREGNIFAHYPTMTGITRICPKIQNLDTPFGFSFFVRVLPMIFSCSNQNWKSKGVDRFLNPRGQAIFWWA